MAKRARSAKSGKFVSLRKAKCHPNTTVVEKVKKKKEVSNAIHTKD